MRNWIRFDQNEKNLALFVVASWKKIKIFYYFSRLYLHTFFPDFSQVWKIAENCCSVRTLSFVRGISLHNLRLYTPVVRGTSVPTWGWIFIFVTIQIWVVLLIGWSKFLTNQKYYPDLGSDAPWYGISELVSQTLFGGEASNGVRKFRSFSYVKLGHLRVEMPHLMRLSWQKGSTYAWQKLMCNDAKVWWLLALTVCTTF